MITPRRHWRSGADRTLLGILLLVLGVTGVLAYQAWDAARSHHRMTEAILRDYAGFAAWELRRRVEANAHATLNAALMPVLVGPFEFGQTPASDLGAFVFGVESAMRACGCADAASDYFTIDPTSRELQLHDATLGSEFQEWLVGEFLDGARSSVEGLEATSGFRVQSGDGVVGDGVRRLVVVGTLGPDRVLVAEPPVASGPSRAVVYTGVRGETNRIYGFAVDVPKFVAPLIEAAVAGPPLLPPSLAGAVENDEVLSATFWLVGQDTVFRSGEEVPAAAAAVDTFQLATGALAARVAVRPAMAGRLVIGGLPSSRVPILLGSVGLTLALLLVALVQLRRQQELYRLRGDFVSGVSHELRTPLAQIRLFSDLLASERLDQDQRRRSMRILTEEAKRLTYLVENVLRFSRAERETEKIAPRPLEAGAFLREVVEDFGPLAQARGASVEVTCPRPVGALLDPDAMRQVLLNLLDNAVKYGPRGQTIEVRAHRDGEWLRIEVDDEGPGIPLPEREHIWEPYRRLSRELEGATGGSGIGLAVVRELVGLHGGRTFVAEGGRGGSRFVLLVPHAEPARYPLEEASTVESRERAGR